jgi:hypothetical protein
MCHQQDQQQGEHAAQQPGATTQDQQKDAPKPKDSLADASRRAREQKKDAAKSGKVFTNDNLPAQGGVSTVGVVNAPAGDTAAATAPPAAAESAAPSDEKSWREQFAKLRAKLAKDQDELDILQREMGVTNVQQYNDPVKAMQQNLSRSDINAKTAKIEEKKKEVEADKQALSDAEEQLRKSGGDAGWAR